VCQFAARTLLNDARKAWQARSRVVHSTVPIIETDYVTAFIPGAACYVLGYHSTQPGTNPPGANSVLVWTLATFIPHSNNPFAPFGEMLWSSAMNWPSCTSIRS